MTQQGSNPGTLIINGRRYEATTQAVTVTKQVPEYYHRTSSITGTFYLDLESAMSLQRTIDSLDKKEEYNASTQ